MKAERLFALIGKCLNPRNPYILFALLGPFLYAGIFQLVIGIIDDTPRIAVFEHGDSAITDAMLESDAVKLIITEMPDEPFRMVEEEGVDSGISLSEDFKTKLQMKEAPPLSVYVNGESLMKSRAVSTAVILQALEDTFAASSNIKVNLQKVGDEKAISLMEAFIPFFVIVIVILGSYLLPASFIVSEKEKGTINALLSTPLTLKEILAAFAIVGILISFAMGILVLVLTVGITQPPVILLALGLGSVLGAEWGILLGLASSNQANLVANTKAINLFIIAPAFFTVFPDWPKWIAGAFPTYYITEPIFRASVYSDSLSDVGWQIAVLALFCAVFSIPVIAFATRYNKKPRFRFLSLVN